MESKELLLFNPSNEEHLNELLENQDFYGRELKIIIKSMWEYIQGVSLGLSFSAEGDVYTLQALNPNAPQK